MAASSVELLGSPGDLSGLGLANHGRARAFVRVTSVPHQTDSAEVLSECVSQCADAHGQASAVTVLLTFPSSAPRAPASLHPRLHPSSEAAVLFWDTNIHTLLEPQIKGGVPWPASQWSLCADGSL